MSQSDFFRSRMKWFLTGEKYFGPVKRFPSWPSSVRYSVFDAWYIVQDTDEDEEVTTYLWSQRRLITRRPTMQDYLKAAAQAGLDYKSMTPGELEMYLPVSVRAPKGLKWPEVVRQKSQIYQEQIAKIESNQEYENRKVVAFVGYWAYPAAGKGNR